MKKMKDLRGLSDEDLKKRIYETRLELSKDTGASEIGTVKNPGRIRSLKRDIARMLTIQNQKAAKGVKASEGRSIHSERLLTAKKGVKK